MVFNCLSEFTVLSRPSFGKVPDVRNCSDVENKTSQTLTSALKMPAPSITCKSREDFQGLIFVISQSSSNHRAASNLSDYI